MKTDSNQEENETSESKQKEDRNSAAELRSILGYIALLSTGFGFAMLLVRFGVFQIDNPHVVSVIEFNSLQAELQNANSKNTEIRSNIIDSISINTLILDTDLGQKRLGILKQELDRMPFFIPTTATTSGDLTKKEKSTDFLIAHWHAYRRDHIGHDESETVLMETLKEVNNENPNASFLIYSSLLGDSAQVEKLKLQIPKEINHDRVSWVKFSYSPSNCQIQDVIHKTLAVGKIRIPK